MVEPRRYKIMVATFSYGGNGGTRSESKDLGEWMLLNDRKLMAEKRISSVVYNDIGDTPVTMTRNQTVMRALNANCDLLLMLDSDMKPDCEMEDDRSAKPFWESSFDFIDMMYDKYPVVVGAPYCGRGSEENVFVFHWTNCFTNNPHEVDMQLVAYTRFHSQLMKGIQPVAALPTGCILYDTRLFRDLFNPTIRYRQLRDLGLTSAEAARAAGSWFEYEYENEFCAQKGSTEDVYNTRDISLAGIQKYGSNPVHCNWDAWAGHWKPKLVRKPQILTADSVSRSLADVVLRGNESGMRIEKVDFSGGKVQDTMTESPPVIVNSDGDDGLPSCHKTEVPPHTQVF